MDRTAGTGGAAASRGDAAGRRLVVLRGELWQRHSQLQGVDRDEARYDEQADELIELTTELLRVEAQLAETSRTSRRRTSWVGFTLAAVLLLGAVGTVLAAPILGSRISWLASGAVLLAVLVVLLLTALARRRHSPAWLTGLTGPAPSATPADDAERTREGPEDARPSSRGHSHVEANPELARG